MGSNPTLNEIVDELEELSDRDTPNIEFEPMDGYSDVLEENDSDSGSSGSGNPSRHE